MGKPRKYTDEEFANAVKASFSITNVLRTLGLCFTGANHSLAKKRIASLGLDISHFTGKLWNKGKKTRCKTPIEDYLSNRKFIGSNALKKRLLREGLIEWKCSCCGITDWLGKRLALELDHIDGNKENNNLENLRILCPNCHSQTNNFNRKKRYATKPVNVRNASDGI